MLKMYQDGVEVMILGFSHRKEKLQMDAVKFLKEWTRMCRRSFYGCDECPLGELQDYSKCMRDTCGDAVCDHPEKSVAIVEKWSAEHPVTRQDKLKEKNPFSGMMDGVSTLCPMMYDPDFDCESEKKDCMDCKREYWMTEVEAWEE